jgi:hypothetical protein
MRMAHCVRNISPSDELAMQGTQNRLAFHSSPSPPDEHCLPLPSGALSTMSQLCGLIAAQLGLTLLHSRRLSVNRSSTPSGALPVKRNTKTLLGTDMIPLWALSVRRTTTGTLTLGMPAPSLTGSSLSPPCPRHMVIALSRRSRIGFTATSLNPMGGTSTPMALLDCTGKDKHHPLSPIPAFLDPRHSSAPHLSSRLFDGLLAR